MENNFVVNRSGLVHSHLHTCAQVQWMAGARWWFRITLGHIATAPLMALRGDRPPGSDPWPAGRAGGRTGPVSRRMSPHAASSLGAVFGKSQEMM